MNPVTLGDAINAFANEMRMSMWTPNAQDRYSRELWRFAKHVGADLRIDSMGVEEARSFLGTFDNHAPSTVALEHTILSSFYKFLVLNDYAPVNPMDKIRRPKVPPLRDRVRTRISSAQVTALLNACITWSERLCLNTLAFLGVRRTALANLRWKDVDGKRWTATFAEKGRKVIAKPVPHELRRLFTVYAIERSQDGKPIDPQEWVVPNRRPMSQMVTRSPRIIYNIVKDVAKRCEITAHVHSFRAAFAVHFLRTNPAQIESLRQLMGHGSINTTQGYLDELESEDAMRVVESMTYGSVAA